MTSAVTRAREWQHRTRMDFAYHPKDAIADAQQILAELCDEVERLRAALRRIDQDAETIYGACKMARDALSTGGEPDGD